MLTDSGSRSHPSDSLPYCLRIGVAGHRHLTNADEIRLAVRRVLERINETLQQQQRTALDWIVVSPLAMGADRIVAEEVLKQSGSSLEVLSPFSLDEYRRDFVEPDETFQNPLAFFLGDAGSGVGDREFRASVLTPPGCE